MKLTTFGCLLLSALFAGHSARIASRAAVVANDDTPKQESASGPRVFKGRVIAPVMTAAGGGAQWLERDDRDANEQPDKVIEALKIPEGATVADVGSGTGYFSLRIAKRIGPKGKVLATDVQPEMIRLLTQNARKAGIENVEPILATDTDAKLPANKVDLALMVDVYHELQDPERAMAQIRKSLKDDGRLVLVEYRGEDPTVPIKSEHKTTLRQIRYEIEPMGFRLKEVFEFLPHQHIEVFVKDDVSGEDEIIDPANFPTIRKPGWAGAPPASFRAGGFTPLIVGKEFAGWTLGRDAWRIRDGVLSGKVSGKQSTLMTEESFDDFELDLQWRLNPDGRSTVRITGRPTFDVRLQSGVPHAAGYPERIAIEHIGQVLDNAAVRIPSTDTAKALVFPGDWNRLTVRCQGNRAAVAINSVKTAEFDLQQSGSRRAVMLIPGEDWSDFREIWLKRLEKQK